jgi:formamidopyrimidine-DNA glycosylase
VPELLEVEVYRRLAERADGRLVAGVDARTRGSSRAASAGRRSGTPWWASACAVPGAGASSSWSTPTVPVLGLRFGMTGRLVLDGTAAIDALLHTSGRDEPSWIRFGLRFADGGALWISDPRRLGGVELDPDEDRLGPDALDLTPAQLRAALEGSRAPLKARLLDQGRVAGLGNLLVDEACWRAGLDPARPAASLSDAELRRLHRHLRLTLAS